MPAEPSSADSAPAESAGTAGFAAFRHRDFRFVFAVRMLNGMATVMLQIAVQWEMWLLTGDPFVLGLVGLVMFAPNLLFFLVTGTVADRYPRQRVLALAYGVQAVASGLLFAVYGADTPLVALAFTVIFLVGAGRAFSQPATSSLLPNVVPPEHFPNAVAWVSSAHQLSVVVGPVIGGFLLIYGGTVVFATCAAAFLLSVVLIAMVRSRQQAQAKGPVTVETLLAGIRYIYRRQIIFGAIALDLLAVLIGSVNALLPIYADDVLGIGEVGLGFLRGAMALGAVLCGLVLIRVPVRRHAGWTLLGTVALFGAALVTFSVSTVAWLSIAALAVAGAADMVSVFIRQTLVQLATPDDMRGRVTAVHGLCTNASGLVGEFRAGSVAALIGTVPAALYGALATVALAVAWMVWFPRLRRVDTLDLETLREDAR